jgi:hypothetical protein
MPLLLSSDDGCSVAVPRRRFSPNVSLRRSKMTMYCALTVRKLKPGTYDEWRKAWGSDEDIPEGAEAYIVRNLKDPNEIVAFGLIEGDMDEIKETFDEDKERVRQDAMAPYIESIGADGIYEVIERIGAKTGATT